MGLLFLIDEKEKERDPPSAVGGLKGIDKRVGSRGKKKNVKERKREMVGITARGKRVRSRGKKKEAHPAKWMSFRSKIQSLRM